MIKKFGFLIYILFCVFTQQLSAQEALKAVDASSYTQNLKKSYVKEDAEIKSPKDIGYSSAPGSKFWRSIRSGYSHQTMVAGVDSSVLINATGEDWRQNKAKMSNVAIIAIGVMFLLSVLLIFLGKFKLKKGFSEKYILRFKLDERIIHWGTASLFILLAITGITLTLGGPLLISLLGKESFAVLASLSKLIHNLFGPIFSVFLIVMIIRFIKDNLYQKGDLNWLLKGGGLFGKHVDVWRFNLGEKMWFWLIFFAGLLISITGYMLLFADVISPSRELNALSQAVHIIAATIMIVAMFGHIYMAIALEGTMSAMTKGDVDENWAKEHHNLWYKEKP